MKFGAPLPLVYWKWKIAKDTGWTLEYIENLPYGRIVEYLQIADATAKANSL